MRSPPRRPRTPHIRRKQMGRPLSKQQLFSANSKNNLKVQFHNGTESVPGYIVKQKSNLQFLCADVDGNRAVCKLVNKTSGNLAEGEMSITLKDY